MDAKSATIASAISQLATDGAGADRVAAFAAESMHAIHLALTPIIGDRGVAALYRRSLLLTGRDAPWVCSSYGDSGTCNDYATLQAAMAQQPAADALRIAQALFDNLYSILATLIGAALTERLLYPMFDTSAIGDAVQEHPNE